MKKLSTKARITPNAAAFYAARFDGNIKQAAARLGCDWSHLYRGLRKYYGLGKEAGHK